MEQDYLSLAIKQILWEFKLNPDLGLEQIIQNAFQLLGDQDRYALTEYVMNELNNQDFEWIYFNDCVKFCRENKIIPSNFYFLSEYPQVPKNVTDFLEQLTVIEIKQIAKNRNIKGLPTRKAEIIEKIVQQCTLSDLKNEIKDLLNRQILNYKQRLFKEKCRFLIDGVCSRYSALVRNKKINLKIFKPIITHNNNNDTMQLLQHCIVAYPEPSTTTDSFQLPPYFLGDTSYIRYEYKRKNQVNHQHHNIIDQQYSESRHAVTQRHARIQSTWMERLLWFISLLWLGMCYLMFTSTLGLGKLVVIIVAILPFVLYWFLQSRKNRENEEYDE